MLFNKIIHKGINNGLVYLVIFRLCGQDEECPSWGAGSSRVQHPVRPWDKVRVHSNMCSVSYQLLTNPIQYCGKNIKKKHLVESLNQAMDKRTFRHDCLADCKYKCYLL